MIKQLAIVSLLFAFCFAAVPLRRRPRLDGRIVGGVPASIEDFPYQLSFEYYGSHRCGASIISNDWVVTAAHCVDGISAKNVQFRAGSSTRGSGGTLHKASQIISNPDYDYYTTDFDIAVVKVSTPFEFGAGVQPISLTTVEPSAGEVSTVSGWGTLSSGGSTPSKLQVVYVPIVDHAKCNNVYTLYGGVTDRMICAGLDQGGKDSCQGDSGGPLVVAGKLAGIVSWGAGCASPGYPGVYSNVANMRNFVVQNTGVN